MRMSWLAKPPRKNEAPKSASELSSQASALAAEIAGDQAEIAEIEGAAADLALEGDRHGAAMARLVQLQAGLPGKRKAHELLVAAVAGAERQAEVRQAIAAHEKATSALAGRLRREWPKIIDPIAALLADLENNRSEARRVAALAAERGVSGVVAIDAETLARQRMDGGREAVTETRKIWVDEYGESVKPFTLDDMGRETKNPRAVKEVERTFTIVEAMRPMPIPFERLADAVRLIGLDGERIGPRG